MTEKILHTVDFVEREEYIEEDYPDHVHGVSASTQIPLPRPGDVVTFGWHEENGEEVERVDLHESGHSESDIEYCRSEQYKILDIDHHYHHSQKTGSDGNLAVNRIEVGTTVIIQPFDDEDDQ